MQYPLKDTYPREEVNNGALILLLLRKRMMWKELCGRFEFADPEELTFNITTRTLRDGLFRLRKLGLIHFDVDDKGDEPKPAGMIEVTELWTEIGMTFGAVSLHQIALLSQNAQGMAVTPVFRRPSPPQQKIDVFALMPFNPKMAEVYANHIKPACEELGLTIQRADDIYAPRPFMDKVWDGICAAQLILADCTEKNPNVFYEIGIAHTVGKKVVLITRSDRDIPSDIRHYEYIRYTVDTDGVDVLIEQLRPLVRSLQAG